MNEERITLPITAEEWNRLSRAQRAETAQAWDMAGRPVPATSLAGMSPYEVDQVRQTMRLMAEEVIRQHSGEREAEAKAEQDRRGATKRIQVKRDPNGKLAEVLVFGGSK